MNFMSVLCPCGEELVTSGSEKEEVDPVHQNESWQNPGKDSGLLTHVNIFCGCNASFIPSDA